MSKFSPGEVEVRKIDLFNIDKSKRLNIHKQTAAIRIYEDVFKPTLYAEITLYDAFDIINNFPIIGEESKVRSPSRSKTFSTTTVFHFRAKSENILVVGPGIVSANFRILPVAGFWG